MFFAEILKTDYLKMIIDLSINKYIPNSFGLMMYTRIVVDFVWSC